MVGLNHPCLCGLMGFCIFPPLIVCEFVSFGDLYTFLHREKVFLSFSLLFFSLFLTSSLFSLSSLLG